MRNYQLKKSLGIGHWALNIPQRGFTLIEVMVVVVLLGVIFGTLASVSGGINLKSRDSQRQTDILNIQSALQQYYADEHVYPDTMPALTTGAPFSGPSGKTYLSKTPVDPSVGTNSPYCYSPQVAKGVAGCSNLVNSPNRCEYYQLCANLEDVSAGATPCSCNSINYNFSAHAP